MSEKEENVKMRLLRDVPWSQKEGEKNVIRN